MLWVAGMECAAAGNLIGKYADSLTVIRPKLIREAVNGNVITRGDEV